MKLLYAVFHLSQLRQGSGEGSVILRATQHRHALSKHCCAHGQLCNQQSQLSWTVPHSHCLTFVKCEYALVWGKPIHHTVQASNRKKKCKQYKTTFPVVDEGVNHSMQLSQLLVFTLHLLQLVLKPLKAHTRQLVAQNKPLVQRATICLFQM